VKTRPHRFVTTEWSIGGCGFSQALLDQLPGPTLAGPVVDGRKSEEIAAGRAAAAA
jgi:hypothetical protein